MKHNSDIKRDVLRTLGNCAYCTREDFHDAMDEALAELAKDGQIHWNNDDARSNECALTERGLARLKSMDAPTAGVFGGDSR